MENREHMGSPKPRQRAAHVVALVVAITLGLVGAQPGLRITTAQGPVEIGAGEPPAWRAARPGDAVSPGDSIRTGRGGRAEIELGTGTVRLYENSLLRLPQDGMRASGAGAVRMEKGSSLFDVEHREGGNPFEVRTPEVVVSVKGTRFSVTLAGHGAAVAVFRGIVGVRTLAAQLEHEVLVREGFAAAGGVERPFELMLAPGGDPWQTWSQGGEAPAAPAKLEAAPVPAAIDDAKVAAREATAAEVVTRAAERDPQIAARVAAIAGNAPKTPETDSTPSADASGSKRDPLIDATKSEADVMLRTDVAEAVLGSTAPSSGGAGGTGGTSGTSGGGTGAGGSAFDIQVIKSGGPNRVHISGGGIDETVTKDQVESVLDTGNTALLPAPLLDELTTRNIDPITFTRMLDEML